MILSTNLVSEFSTGSVEHTLIFGGEYVDTSSDQFRLNSVFEDQLAGVNPLITNVDADTAAFSVNRPINFNNGVGVLSGNIPTTNSFTDLNDDTETDITVTSFYIQDQIAISEKLDIVVGLRYDDFDIDVTSVNIPETGEDFDGSTTDSSSNNSEVSPRLGIIYKPEENVSLYASYSESFLPRSGEQFANIGDTNEFTGCLLYTSPSPRDLSTSRMPSSA